ncbi:hypothetical protein [Endozoicomonas sp. ONNA2]|uniref:hypothetical protein n=1 Tax=Endozoicomonas sp. ONNA2 TaxID=2828741 RepID=UPI00214827FD|nr:hypothetical protein [Endozoicomonas sp. ONNA2]
MACQISDKNKIKENAVQALELKIPRPLQVILFGAAMWLAGKYIPRGLVNPTYWVGKSI